MFYLLVCFFRVITFIKFTVQRKSVHVYAYMQRRETNKNFGVCENKRIEYFGFWLMWKKFSYQNSLDKVSKTT